MKLYHNNWKPEFDEAKILFYCIRRAKPASAHGLLTPIRLTTLRLVPDFPLIPFIQTRIMLPNDPEAMLIQLFGQGWKVPYPFFILTGPTQKPVRAGNSVVFNADTRHAYIAASNMPTVRIMTSSVSFWGERPWAH